MCMQCCVKAIITCFCQLHDTEDKRNQPEADLDLDNIINTEYNANTSAYDNKYNKIFGMLLDKEHNPIDNAAHNQQKKNKISKTKSFFRRKTKTKTVA